MTARILSCAVALCFTGAAFAQNTMPNSRFVPLLAPWTSSGVVSTALKRGAQLDPAAWVSVSGKLFGQGHNVILLVAAGKRDIAARTASVDLATGAYGSASTAFQIPTPAKLPASPQAIYGPGRQIAWIPTVAPLGNGNGTFTIATTDDFGVIVSEVYSFPLLAKNQVPSGGVVGYGRLTSGGVATGNWDTLAVTGALNGGVGYLTRFPLTVGAYAPGTNSSLSRMEFYAKATMSNHLDISLFDFVAGAWVAMPAPGVGAAFVKITLNIAVPQRFIDPSSKVVLARIEARYAQDGVVPSMTLRSFRLIP